MSSRTKPFAPWRLKCLPTLRTRFSDWSVGFSPCCVLIVWLRRKNQRPQPRGRWLFLIPSKGRRDRAEAHRLPKHKRAAEITNHFSRLCSALKHSKKKHFVTKNKNYTTSFKPAHKDTLTPDSPVLELIQSHHSRLSCPYLLLAFQIDRELKPVWWLQMSLCSKDDAFSHQ